MSKNATMKCLGFAGLGFLVLSCGVPMGGSPRPGCEAPTSDRFFFPEGAFGKKQDSFDEDGLRRAWYSKHLRAMAEPTLSCKTPRGEVYRFLWLRSFDRPVAIRVAGIDEAAVLAAVELDGAGGYEPGKVRRRVQRRLTPEEWQQIADGIAAIDFWRMPGGSQGHGLDGARWILEGRRGTEYHVVDRLSPERGAFRELCLLLLEVAGLLEAGSDGRSSRLISMSRVASGLEEAWHPSSPTFGLWLHG